eukprot:6488615-Amphidinium_carterae.1
MSRRAARCTALCPGQQCDNDSHFLTRACGLKDLTIKLGEALCVDELLVIEQAVINRPHTLICDVASMQSMDVFSQEADLIFHASVNQTNPCMRAQCHRQQNKHNGSVARTLTSYQPITALRLLYLLGHFGISRRIEEVQHQYCRICLFHSYGDSRNS